jgi:hypothetical protein
LVSKYKRKKLESRIFSRSKHTLFLRKSKKTREIHSKTIKPTNFQKCED